MRCEFPTTHRAGFSHRMGRETMTSPDSQQEVPSDSPVPERAFGRSAGRFGFVLILLSGVLWFSLFAIPFLPLTVAQKAAVAGADFIGVQIAWWTGAALVGPQTAARIKSWFRRGKKTE